MLGSAEAYCIEQSAAGVFFNLKKAGDGRPGMLLSNEASMAAVLTKDSNIELQVRRAIANLPVARR